jgi:hypothetical protein
MKITRRNEEVDDDTDCFRNATISNQYQREAVRLASFNFYVKQFPQMK